MAGRKQTNNHAGRYRLSSGQRNVMDAETRQQKEEARKVLEERKKRKKRNIQEQKQAAAARVSYVRKPLSKRSLYSLGFLILSLLLGGYGLYQSVTTKGGAELSSAAMALCSMLLGAVALWYGIISFLEEGKKYILAKISVPLSSMVLVVWIITIIIGIRG